MSHDLNTIKKRLIESYLKMGQCADMDNYSDTQASDGQWTDINYDDTANTNWNPIFHLNRLYDMTIAYKSCDSKYYKSEKTLDAIKKGLGFWYQKKPTSNNWWQIQIGQQQRIGPILIMLGSELPDDLIFAGAKYLYDPTQLHPGKTTGQNLVWIATETIHRGLINQNEADVAEGLNYIKNEIRFSEGEGIQPDFSFCQHGKQLYSGGYGLWFLIDTAYWVAIVAGTKFEFENNKIDILTGLLLDGDRWMIRGKELDPSVQGREICRKNNCNKALLLLPVCNILAEANLERAKEIERLKCHIQGSGELNSIRGNKYFMHSDYMAHQREKYFASVRMVSSRTIGTELINNENIKGFWLPFGLTYIFQRGDEYNDIFPVWDWARLPGVTSPYKTGKLEYRMTHDESFVGGVSDGVFGAAAMCLNKMDTSARKGWFFFNDEFVALGAGIASTDDGRICTTVNQCLFKESVVVDGIELCKGEAILDSVSWVLHDGIGYVFPENMQLTIKAGPQSGSWKSIKDQYTEEEITRDVFALWISHGEKPMNESYQYIVVPGTNAAMLNEYVSCSPITVIKNTTDIQAVRHKTLGVTEIVFYSPSKLEIRAGLKITADKPCMVIINEKGETPAITVSNPLWEDGIITVDIETDKKSFRKSFSFSGKGLAGSSITNVI